MATTPTLGGTTLPDPSTYNETVSNRGAYREMADGTVVTDLVTASVKRTFRMTWSAITNAQKATILTAWATIDDSSATFRPPTYDVLSTDYTVTRDPSQTALTLEAIGTPSALRWNVEMALREA